MDPTVAQHRSENLSLSRHLVARKRQTTEVRVFSLGFERDRFIAPVHAGWDRLVFARSGAGILRIGNRACLLDARQARWARDLELVEIEARPALDLRIAYVRPAGRASGAVLMTPLAGELLERAVERGWLDPHDARDARLLSVIDDELHALLTAPYAFALTLPQDARARRIAEACASDDSGALRTAREMSDLCHCSPRTLERIFLAQTGSSFVAWQRRFRLVVAAAALANGESVTEAGFVAGYAGTSAFVTAFRRAFGTTPGVYARSR